MYKSGKYTSPSLSGYSFKGYAEIIDPQKYPELKIYTNANLARDLVRFQVMYKRIMVHPLDGEFINNLFQKIVQIFLK